MVLLPDAGWYHSHSSSWHGADSHSQLSIWQDVLRFLLQWEAGFLQIWSVMPRWLQKPLWAMAHLILCHQTGDRPHSSFANKPRKPKSPSYSAGHWGVSLLLVNLQHLSFASLLSLFLLSSLCLSFVCEVRLSQFCHSFRGGQRTRALTFRGPSHDVPLCHSPHSLQQHSESLR